MALTELPCHELVHGWGVQWRDHERQAGIDEKVYHVYFKHLNGYKLLHYANGFQASSAEDRAPAVSCRDRLSQLLATLCPAFTCFDDDPNSQPAFCKFCNAVSIWESSSVYVELNSQAVTMAIEK